MIQFITLYFSLVSIAVGVFLLCRLYNAKSRLNSHIENKFNPYEDNVDLGVLSLISNIMESKLSRMRI